MKPEDIKDKKIAVLCDTIEKAKIFLEMHFEERPFQIESGAMFDIISRKHNCSLIKKDLVYFYSKERCEENGYKIITFEEFIKEDENDRTLTAVEVLEVLVNEYVTGKYDEIFGYNPCFLELTSRFTPAEIVQKVTEWKRKQDNKTKITEDMIADALDEKYGVGNWRREE